MLCTCPEISCACAHMLVLLKDFQTAQSLWIHPLSRSL